MSPQHRGSLGFCLLPSRSLISGVWLPGHGGKRSLVAWQVGFRSSHPYRMAF